MTIYGYVGGGPLIDGDELGLAYGDWWDLRTYADLDNWKGAGDAVVDSITNPKYLRCSADAIINGMISQVPFAGTAADLAGFKFNPLGGDSMLNFGDYDTVDPTYGALGGVGEVIGHKYDKLGGDAQLLKYSGEAGKGVLGKRPRAALAKLSKMKFAQKAIGGIGFGTGVIDMINDISDCDKCK